MALVSIIVPVYQVEQYLRQCIDSILAQTFTDFELILVDDGSKDGCGAICDAYAAGDQRVKVIHKENGGLSDARNCGMDYASGSYFMFVDSDDFIAPTMVESLYQNILQKDVDIAACNFLYYFDQDAAKNFSTAVLPEIIPGTDIFYNRKNDRSYGFWTVAWNKLYKSDVFGTCRFRVGKYHEDEFWANEIYQMDIRVATIADCLYFYRQRENSIMSKPSAARNLDILEAMQERLQIYLKNDQYSSQAYRVLLYSLEYLEKSKRLSTEVVDKTRFFQAEQQTKNIVKQLKRRKLSAVQHISLVLIGANPCSVFALGMRFRGLLERFI